MENRQKLNNGKAAKTQKQCIKTHTESSTKIPNKTKGVNSTRKQSKNK